MALRDFLVSMFPYAKTHYSITNLNHIKSIMYADADKGTVYQGSQAMHYNFSKRAPYTVAYDWLSREIHLYLTNTTMETKTSFDNWHENTCRGFIAQCSTFHCTITYGLAQKFINLALKYCYCFNDADKAEALNKFKFAHIPLDSFTFCPSTTSKTSAAYRKYTRTSPLGLSLPFYTATVNPMISISSLPAWSKLSDVLYKNIQDDVRSYFVAHPITYSAVSALDVHGLARCSSSTTLTPFQCEFLLW